MKKFKIFVLGIIFIGLLTGCGKGSKVKDGIEGFNGIYRNGKDVFYIVATSDSLLEYYVVDALKNKNYGILYYQNGVAIDYEFGEDIKVSLKANDLVVELKDTANFKAGTYKRIDDFTVDEYYEDNYGKNEYYDSSYNGVYTNKDGDISIYQPTKKYVEVMALVNDNITSCEIDLTKDKELTCDSFGTVYTFKVDGDKLTYTVKSNQKDSNYTGVFSRSSKLSKSEIINTFDPVGILDE